jgi:heat shock protein HtpX
MALGYITQATENQRRVRWLFISYILAFELLAAFALTILLLFFDPQNTILTNPLGYAMRYTLPVALVAGIMFRIFYHGHIKHVARKLNVMALEPSAFGDPQVKRFLRIGEEQCLALGVRMPLFGIIEAMEPNALAVGATRDNGLIAVTRGLLNQMDDEEVAAVIAHEVAHIRNGDTKVMAASHALMRTSVNFQVNNPLRIEDPVQLLVVLAIPFFLPILLAGGAATMFAMQLSFQARRGITMAKDLVADSDAVRVILFPEALVSALRKVAVNGAFDGSENFKSLLFCVGTSGNGRMDASVNERIQAIEQLGGAMMQEGRVRRDTRSFAAQPHLGIRARASAPKTYEALKPPPPCPHFMEILAHPSCYVEWYKHNIDYWEWKEGDKRNVLGIKPKMYLPLAAVVTFLLIFHIPSDGNYKGALAVFNPASLVELASGTRSQIAATSQPTLDCKKGSTDKKCDAPPTAVAKNGGLEVFTGASEEARRKQFSLALYVLAFALFSALVPGLRERVFPNVDWELRDKMHPGGPLEHIFGPRRSAFEWALSAKKAAPGYEERVELEFAKLREAHERGELGEGFSAPPPPQAEPHYPLPPRSTGFGRKGL